MSKLYDDRIEIVNPGGLPRGLDKKSFKHTSIRRNEIIADLFNRMEEMDRTGSGIRKMKDAIIKVGLQPPVFLPDTFFHAIFYRDPKYSLKTLGTKGTDGLGVNEEKVLNALLEDRFVTIIGLAEKLKISSTAIEKQYSQIKGQWIGQKNWIR